LASGAITRTGPGAENRYQAAQRGFTGRDEVSGCLEGKVVAITGAGRGIGRELALHCAAQGAAIVVNDPGVAQAGDGGDTAPAETTANDIIASGGKAAANFGNVADPKEAASIVEDAVARFGRIDAVVNNAGILRDTIWHKMSYEDWKSVIDVNLTGVFNVSKAATPHFREQQSGSFIHFTSTSGLIGNIGQANYSAAKLGVVALSQSIALDMARVGVRDDIVDPRRNPRAAGARPADAGNVGGQDCPARRLPCLRSVARCHQSDLQRAQERDPPVFEAAPGALDGEARWLDGGNDRRRTDPRLSSRLRARRRGVGACLSL
jgi:NAD(P)-dependent dehydrogenase (short-subunit alcohol dehydrogenase family)